MPLPAAQQVVLVAEIPAPVEEWEVDLVWNENPRPFVRRKTVEEILDSLARYVQRISGAEH